MFRYATYNFAGARILDLEKNRQCTVSGEVK